MKAGVILTHEDVTSRRIYGISSVTRLQRQLREAGCESVFLAEALLRAPVPVTHLLIVDDRQIIDDRIFAFLQSQKAPDVCLHSSYPIVLLRGEKAIADAIASLRAGDGLPIDGAVVVTRSEMDSYISDLRLKAEPYVIDLSSSSDVRTIENRMYEANFKGTLDFIATYIYKYPVREITRNVSRVQWLTPNVFTALSIFCSFAFPFFFAQGNIALALTLGWTMFIADSVDGKLARLTVRLSRIAGMIEHGTSAPAMWLWFIGMGWYFSRGQLLTPENPATVATWILTSLYWLDKGVNGVFKTRFKRDMYDFTPLDKRFHLIACRRAVILFIVTAGYFTAHFAHSFLFLAGWMIVSFAFHTYRLFWLTRQISKHR